MILFVCTGNTCRSPMAAALAANMLAQAGIECAVRSAGVGAFDGGCASVHAVTVMREENCDLTAHRSQQLTEALLLESTLVLTMTTGHRTAVLSAYPSTAGKVFTLCEYAESGQDISDPFGGDYAVYRACATQIKDLLQLCIDKFRGGKNGSS